MAKKTKQHVIWNVSFVLVFSIQYCESQYILDVMKKTPFGEEELVHKCLATGANFGRDISDFIMADDNYGCAVAVEPIDACAPAKVEPLTMNDINCFNHQVANHSRSCQNWFALVSRSNYAHPCKFSHQAFNVQNSSSFFRIVIFYNHPGQDPIPMVEREAELRDRIHIPVLMISNLCKDEITHQFTESAGYYLRVRIDPGYYELFRYLIPFLVVILFCFALFLITLCVRTCVERRKLNKRRLSKRNLKKIPVKKYRLGDDPDTCAICLENFAPGEKLRHLPCRHVFHCKCIDVWLTQTRKVCPLCKRKIGSDSDSDCSASDLATRSQGHEQPLFPGDHVAFEELPAIPTGQFNEMWSSQEALVDQDIVLINTTRRTITGFVRSAIKKLRNDPAQNEEDSEAGSESTIYLIRSQPRFHDSNHFIENERADQQTVHEPNRICPETTIVSDTNATDTQCNQESSSDF